MFSDPWISRETSFKPILPRPKEAGDLKVAALINETGTWNVSLLKDLLWDEDAAIITNIPICKTMDKDDWIWHYSKNGLFSAWSAYKIDASGLIGAGWSRTGVFENWWKKALASKNP